MLYSEAGWVIVRNFCSADEIAELLDESKLASYEKKSPHVSTKTFLVDVDQSDVQPQFKRLMTVGWRTLHEAKKIILWMASYDDPKALVRARGPYIRFMDYTSDRAFAVHYDAPQNDSAMVFLTEFGRDYLGGLYVWDRFKGSSPVLIDQFCRAGDLLIFDANRFCHWVDMQPSTTGSCSRKTVMGAFTPYREPGSTYSPNLTHWVSLSARSIRFRQGLLRPLRKIMREFRVRLKATFSVIRK